MGCCCGAPAQVPVSVECERLPELTHVDLSGRKLRRAELQPFLAALPSAQRLVSVQLSWNCIGDDGTAALCDALKPLSACRELILAGNGITDVGAATLSRLLAAPACRLSLLSLSANRIGTEGLLGLCTGLRENATLVELRLGGNKIVLPDATPVLDALGPNRSLMLLDLSDNDVATPVLQELDLRVGEHRQQRLADVHPLHPPPPPAAALSTPPAPPSTAAAGPVSPLSGAKPPAAQFGVKTAVPRPTEPDAALAGAAGVDADDVVLELPLS
eukprot:TRINITY_DN36568_c0_g1_i1.p1 TRINITY_DN36568_c0_g1~~TRINITY_DN36568_c0_g1_i1.p1  ORF type:complete len:273 (+),score=78.16 TRINITY_DN36568_c0_g1_i1:52-870(+)